MGIPVLKLSDGVYLDGNKIEGIEAINIDSSVNSFSEVTLKIICKVEGVDPIDKTTESTDAYKITTGTLPADTITSDGKLDWEVMKERVLERSEMIGKQQLEKSNPSYVSSSQVGVHDSEILTELKEIKQLIKEYTANAAERDYKAAQLNAYYAFHDPKKMPKLEQYYPFLKSTDDSKEPELTIPLMIDGNKFGELITKTLNEYSKQMGSTELNL